jgi:hypothetical protein
VLAVPLALAPERVSNLKIWGRSNLVSYIWVLASKLGCR